MRIRMDARVRKILILASVLVLMLALSGCRTRVTNNSEVVNVIHDEDGYMSEEYQLRRDELSLSKAEKPIITGWGTPSDEDLEDYEGSDDFDALDDYEAEEYDDEYADDENEEVTSPSTSGTTTGNTPRRGSTVIRRRPTRTTPSKTAITVTLNANGGKCSADAIKVRNGGKYSGLSSVTISRSADKNYTYKFSGWYTKKSGGSKVTKDTKVTATSKHTLYAHWKKTKKKAEEQKEEETKPTPTPTPTPTPEPEKKTYTVTLDINGNAPEGASIKFDGNTSFTVEEGGTYSVPGASCEGYFFKGWTTSDGKEVNAGDVITITSDLTLTPQWEKDPDYEYNKWDKDLGDTVSSLKDDDKAKYVIAIGGEKGEDFLKGSGLKKGSDEDCDYIVVFGSKDEAEGVENPDGKTILVIPKEAIKGSTKDAAKLLYKIKVYDKVYGGYGDDVDTAASDLGVDDSEDIVEL